MAKPSVTVSVDARAYNQMLRDLSFILGRSVSYRDLVRSETRSILQTTARRTKSASAKAMRERYRIPKGREKVRGWGAKVDGKTVFLHWKFTAERWARIVNVSRRAKLIDRLGIRETQRRIIATRGLAKQSWLHLAVALNMFINVPGYVYEARTLRGKVPLINARATQQFGEGPIGFIEINNRSPSANNRGSGGRGALNGAIRGRINFFNRNLREGAFRKASDIARAYPGVNVR